MINLNQFAQPVLLKFLFQNKNVKIISGIVNLKKIYLTILIYIMFMFYNEIPLFYQDFKSLNLRLLNLYIVYAARTLDLSVEVMLSPSKRGTKYLYNRLFLHAATDIKFLFLRNHIHRCFWDVLSGCKFWDLQCKNHVSD